MRVLVACEFSGRVRDCFIAKGHDAISCDLIPSVAPGPHYQGNVLDLLEQEWDMMVAFPPCTYLAASGAQWYRNTPEEDAALDFVAALLNAPIKHIALENPKGRISSFIRQPDQIVQPYWFGDPYRKTTCLWLWNLPPLMPTLVITNPDTELVHNKQKGKGRSITPWGLARAMANQWG